MSILLEIAKTYPLAAFLLIAVPAAGGFCVGIIGAYTGYENLATRLRNDKQVDRIEDRTNEIVSGVKSLQLPAETIRRYEAELRAAGYNNEILQRLIAQYDQLSAATTQFEKSTERPNPSDRINSAEHILNEMRSVLPTAQFRPGPAGNTLVLKTGVNTFRVTFSVPMRIPPDIQFPNLPAGVTANVLEKTKVGFTVIFTPSSIAMDTMPGFTASAQL